MHELQLRHPTLGFWIDVRLRDFDGRWLAVAVLADEPDVGVGLDPREALEGALAALGPKIASEMAWRARRVLGAIAGGWTPAPRGTGAAIAGVARRIAGDGSREGR